MSIGSVNCKDPAVGIFNAILSTLRVTVAVSTQMPGHRVSPVALSPGAMPSSSMDQRDRPRNELGVAVVRLLLKRSDLDANIAARAERGACTLQKEHMKYLGILAIGAAAAACSSNNAPPAASADSIDQATNTPNGSDFSPAANDGTASAASDGHSTTVAGTQKTAALPGAASTPATQTQPAPAAPEPSPGNAAGLPMQNTAVAPDNSRVNARDQDNKTLTAMDQGGSEADRKITAQVRQAVVKDGSLSFTAKNVKIITINGKVTLRGPVKTEAERTAIEAAAKSAAGVTQVDNQLEVKK